MERFSTVTKSVTNPENDCNHRNHSRAYQNVQDLILERFSADHAAVTKIEPGSCCRHPDARLNPAGCVIGSLTSDARPSCRVGLEVPDGDTQATAHGSG